MELVDIKDVVLTLGSKWGNALMIATRLTTEGDTKTYCGPCFASCHVNLPVISEGDPESASI